MGNANDRHYLGRAFGQHVFNFEGELLTKVNFDLPLNVIRVDAEMNVLYGISPTSDDAIYYFSLDDYGL